MSQTNSPVAGVETITPARAHELLATKDRPDRFVTQTHVDKLATDMRLGFWTVNGESIKVNEEGEVIDGQHRLHACIKADKAFESLVVRGLSGDDEVQYTTDNGRKRSTADALRIRGESYVNEISGALSQQWRFLAGKMPYTLTPSVSVALKLFARFGGDEEGPGLRHSAGTISQLRHGAGRIIPISGTLSTWGHYVFGEITRRTADVDPDLNNEFWKGLYHGIDLVEDDPRLHLRNRFAEHAQPTKATRTLNRAEMVALTIKAWNHYANSQAMKASKLKWRQVGPSREAFPVIEGQELLEDWFRIRL